ncbi:MAG: HAD-IA family hydrolase, partial [Nanoarchaeota archaeon]|nr:HAD-IA family hydrolase [Nanoarchaeota archaeon]
IINQLKKYFPNEEILTEESKNKVRKKSFFCVDPIDGTKEFLKSISSNKYNEYSVQIGYVKKGEVILGVVYQPAIDKLYYATKGKGAHINYKNKTKRIFTKQTNKIIVGKYNIDTQLKRVLKKKFFKTIKDVSLGGGFGVKVCLVAEGKYDKFVHTNYSSKKVHASLWDSCAPDIILKEAGGRSYEINTLNNIKYDPKKIALTKGYIACANRSKKIFVFDVDGVLGDFQKLKIIRDVAHIKNVAKKNKLNISKAKKLFYETRKKLKTKGKHSTINVMQKLGITKKEYYNIMNSVSVKNRIIITKNAKKTLKKLSKENAIVSLTNTPYFAMKKTLQHLRLFEFFDKLYCIDTHNYIKPSMKIFRTILKEFNCKKGISIGDNLKKDIVPAKKVGLKTIWYTKEKKEEKYVDYKIDDLKEIIEIEK